MFIYRYFNTIIELALAYCYYIEINLIVNKEPNKWQYKAKERKKKLYEQIWPWILCH